MILDPSLQNQSVQKQVSTATLEDKIQTLSLAFNQTPAQQTQKLLILINNAYLTAKIKSYMPTQIQSNLYYYRKT